MYLKSLKLVGFKSFADRTRLELRPGVTVIVGPNGAGKSNIVDAVAWVMGTQSPKSLRTGKMDDVIFAGTATRPVLGRAEVTMILDNASGALPLDLPEVAITRRLYRDGSSDYEINGVGCRLLDIQELLSDSGVGRHQHVIVGQGQIDQILSATPEDHRAVIEEAAGILKHRVRKEKASRRLERTDADLVRLHDLLRELKRQMRPLRRQAKAADRYQGLADETRALRLYLAGEDLRQIGRRQDEVASGLDRLGAEAADAEAEWAELGSVASILRRRAGELGEALDSHGAAAARIETTVERLRRIAQVAQERRRAGLARLEGGEERRRDLEEERHQLQVELEQVRQEEAAFAQEARALERRFREAEAEERSLADQEATSPEGAVAIVRGDLRSLAVAAERDGRERAALERRIEALATQRESEEAEIERVNQEIRTIDAEVGAAQSRYQEAERERRAEQGRWEAAEAAQAEARVALAAARARAEAVEQAVGGMVDPEAREMVIGHEGAAGSLMALMDVPLDLTAAVAAALGPWADAVAFSDRERLGEAVRFLKGAGRGGVPMVDATSPREEVPAREVAKEVGFDALVDLLGSAGEQGIADRLLGDVVLAEGWVAGWQLVERHPDIRVVTPEGDLITSLGMRAAHPDGFTPAMLESALAQVEAAETELARTTSLHTQARRAFDRARTIEREALEHLEGLEARLAGATETLGRLRRGVATVTEELSALEERCVWLDEAAEQRDRQRRELEERLGALEGEEAARQQAWEQLMRRRQEAAEEREQARAVWQEAAAAHRASIERLGMLERRLATVAATLDEEQGRTVDPERLVELESIARLARWCLDVLTERLRTLRAHQAELRQQAADAGRRLSDVQAASERLTELISKDRELTSALSVEAAELRVRAESVAESLRRDLDASVEEALAAARPDGEDLRERLVACEAELRRMGPVNPLAAEEYRELEERHDFLAAQLQDLESSRDELRKVIRALDDEIEQRFLAAFGEVAAAYETNFGVLFPGGRGRLQLTDPDHPLSSGVEIEAQPLGKRVSKMSLLSGGERSLAALAFLFAVFRSRPSPFYLLDEAEAALDDANLRRFLKLLESFRGDAQLIVITHQQQTMEAADVLYGVTMEPGGSSRVVAKPLTDMAELERLESGGPASV